MYQMKSPGTRHRFMAALMISSQLLLTAFVVYWLLGQYRDGKEQLHEQLKHEYYQVHDQLVDSMLLKHLVLPSLAGSVKIEVVHQDTDDPQIMLDSVSTVLMRKQYVDELPDDIEFHAFHLDGSAGSDTGTRSIDITSTITDEERMVRSVKLFINENPEAFRSDTGMQVYTMKLDSSSLVFNIESALEEKDWTFALQWPEDLSKTDRAAIHGILLGGEPSSQLPVIQVQKYNAYLIRSIVPQMLFVLILLLLSASALLFAYRSLNRQLALNKLRDDFIGNISHELKTPVSTVKIALEALHKYDIQKDPKVSGEYLKMAASEVARLEKLVGRVLHHDMLRNPSLGLQKEHCDLGGMVQRVLRTLEIPIRETGAEITVLKKDKACLINVDPVYMEGVILNLLDNSLKYAGAEPEIEIQIGLDGSGTTLSVLDHGPGIPREFREQVFEKFFRVPAGDKHNVKGYGLGLNFASQVMAKHGGSISLKQNPAGGSIFLLHFPNTQA